MYGPENLKQIFEDVISPYGISPVIRMSRMEPVNAYIYYMGFAENKILKEELI